MDMDDVNDKIKMRELWVRVGRLESSQAIHWCDHRRKPEICANRLLQLQQAQMAHVYCFGEIGDRKTKNLTIRRHVDTIFFENIKYMTIGE